MLLISLNSSGSSLSCCQWAEYSAEICCPGIHYCYSSLTLLSVIHHVQVSSSEAELATISLHSFIERHMSVSLSSVEKREVLAQIGIMHQSMTDIHSGYCILLYLAL